MFTIDHILVSLSLLFNVASAIIGVRNHIAREELGHEVDVLIKINYRLSWKAEQYDKLKKRFPNSTIF